MSLRDPRILETYFEIQSLIYQWAHCLDQGKYSEIPDLFTDEGIYIFDENWDIRGRAQLEARYRDRAATDRVARHVSTNLIISVLNSDRASGTGTLTVYRHVGAGLGSTVPASVQDFKDIYEKSSDGRWRFAERRLTQVFALTTGPGNAR